MVRQFQIALIYNIEAAVAASWLERSFIYRCDVSIRWSAGQFPAEFFYCIIRAFRDCLYRTVRHVTNGSDHAAAGRGPDSEIAEANALNSAFHDEPLCRLHISIDRPEASGYKAS